MKVCNSYLQDLLSRKGCFDTMTLLLDWGVINIMEDCYLAIFIEIMSKFNVQKSIEIFIHYGIHLARSEQFELPQKLAKARQGWVCELRRTLAKLLLEEEG